MLGRVGSRCHLKKPCLRCNEIQSSVTKSWVGGVRGRKGWGSTSHLHRMPQSAGDIGSLDGSRDMCTYLKLWQYIDECWKLPCQSKILLSNPKPDSTCPTQEPKSWRLVSVKTLRQDPTVCAGFPAQTVPPEACFLGVALRWAAHADMYGHYCVGVKSLNCQLSQERAE